ncbi:SDR family oxidoreductase [Microtetraspora glauca]|uniref:SDR family oxidoreductase n=1 Tax=Microtetraspora glauca TaxID=1996 RepID=A0ABV3GKN5_MICGL
MPRTVLLTGATGTVSTAVIRALSGTDVHLRALVRDPSRLRAADIDTVEGDLDDPASLDAAFDGVQDVWLLTPNGPRAPENNMNALWAARTAGVERIVRLSAIGAAHDAPNRSGRLHALSDAETAHSGMQWTILRPHWFMQNLLGEAATIATGTLPLNMGDARLGMIDARDIAACAARVLTDDPAAHHQKIYTLTGPEALNFHEVADRMSHTLDTRIGYDPTDDDTYRRRLLGHGVPPWIVDMVAEYGHAYAAGWNNITTGTVSDLTGRPPRDLTAFVRDHATAFTART